MKITDRVVEHIADLARLELHSEEKLSMTEQLGKIVGYMDKLNELDTTTVEPTSHILPVCNVFREDAVTHHFPDADLMANAPRKDRRHYQVPKVLGS